ncbi:hypothetical protein GUJ93_ZPchr2171g28978 [Zizania palustris]|uniref:Uncharacterized protein n=1 Tax=Zizania palustris TaxID=103762 RepID=A0A8J5RBL4_ZIZPA|nr:hypothetical protein GUJ93_ZPchr2171g28978 [Zizania palustris]
MVEEPRSEAPSSMDSQFEGALSRVIFYPNNTGKHSLRYNSMNQETTVRLINVKQYDKNAIKWGGNMAENLSSLRKRKTYLRKFVLTPQSSVACEPRVRQRAAEPRVEAVEFHLRLLCRIGRNLGSVRAAANRSSSIARHTSSASALHTLDFFAFMEPACSSELAGGRVAPWWLLRVAARVSTNQESQDLSILMGWNCGPRSSGPLRSVKMDPSVSRWDPHVYEPPFR